MESKHLKLIVGIIFVVIVLVVVWLVCKKGSKQNYVSDLLRRPTWAVDLNTSFTSEGLGHDAYYTADIFQEGGGMCRFEYNIVLVDADGKMPVAGSKARLEIPTSGKLTVNKTIEWKELAIPGIYAVNTYVLFGVTEDGAEIQREVNNVLMFPNPKVAITGDKMIHRGEQKTIVVSFTNPYVLAEPRSPFYTYTNVRMSVTCNDPSVDLDPNDIELDPILPGKTATYPIIIMAAPQAKITDHVMITVKLNCLRAGDEEEFIGIKFISIM
jgi:hypothetical protein